MHISPYKGLRAKTRGTALAIILAACGATAAHAADNAEWNRQMEEAQRLYARGEQAKCLIITNRIIDAVGGREKSHADSVLTMRAQHLCGNANIALGNGTRGLTLLKSSADYAKRMGDTRFLAKAYNSLFQVYSNTLEFSQAQDLLTQAIELSAGDRNNLIRLYNNRGLVYYAQEEYAKALDSMRKALSLTTEKDMFERSQIFTNMAEVFYKQGIYSKAELWLTKATDALHTERISQKTVQTFLNMALVKAKLGKAQEARAIQKDIYSVLPTLPLPAKVNSLRQMADICLVLGDSEKALDDMLSYDKLADSLQHIDNYSQMQQLLVAYDTERLTQHNAALKQTLKTRTIVGYGSLAFLFVVIAFSVLLWLKAREDKRKGLLIAEQKERLLKYEKEENERKQRMMSLELEHKNRQLTSYTIDLAAVNDFHQKVGAEVDALRSMIDECLGGSNTAKAAEGIHAQTKKLSAMLAHFNDKPVNEDFRIFFEEVHPDYLKKLSHSFPKLTDNDLRLCAYIYLGMSTKEIAALTYREVRSVESSRNRLRKKLELEPAADVRAFLMSLDAGFNSVQ